jgi:hypothetical protein
MDVDRSPLKQNSTCANTATASARGGSTRGCPHDLLIAAAPGADAAERSVIAVGMTYEPTSGGLTRSITSCAKGSLRRGRPVATRQRNERPGATVARVPGEHATASSRFGRVQHELG